MKSVKLGNETITAPVLLLVEGQDEEYLVQKMCEYWFKDRAKLVDIECVEGGENFPARFKALKVRSLGELKVEGVIADSEENPDATAQRWKGLFEDVTASIAQPCKLLQLPTNQLPGAFEAMLLDALDGDLVVGCAKDFRNCVLPHIGQRTRAQQDKIAVQAWLSASLGNAYGNVFKAQKKYPEKALFNYDHAAFEPIKQFIQGLLADAEAVLP